MCFLCCRPISRGRAFRLDSARCKRMSVRPTRCRDLFYDVGPLSPPSPMLGGSWWELVKGIAPTLETGKCEGGLEHYDLSLLLPSKIGFSSTSPFNFSRLAVSSSAHVSKTGSSRKAAINSAQTQIMIISSFPPPMYRCIRLGSRRDVTLQFNSRGPPFSHFDLTLSTRF